MLGTTRSSCGSPSATAFAVSTMVYTLGQQTLVNGTTRKYAPPTQKRCRKRDSATSMCYSGCSYHPKWLRHRLKVRIFGIRDHGCITHRVTRTPDRRSSYGIQPSAVDLCRGELRVCVGQQDGEPKLSAGEAVHQPCLATSSPHASPTDSAAFTTHLRLSSTATAVWPSTRRCRRSSLYLVASICAPHRRGRPNRPIDLRQTGHSSWPRVPRSVCNLQRERMRQSDARVLRRA